MYRVRQHHLPFQGSFAPVRRGRSPDVEISAFLLSALGLLFCALDRAAASEPVTFRIEGATVLAFLEAADAPGDRRGREEAAYHVGAALDDTRACLGDLPVDAQLLIGRVFHVLDGSETLEIDLAEHDGVLVLLAAPGRAPEILETGAGPASLIVLLPEAAGKYFGAPHCFPAPAMGGLVLPADAVRFCSGHVSGAPLPEGGGAPQITWVAYSSRETPAALVARYAEASGPQASEGGCDTWRLPAERPVTVWSVCIPSAPGPWSSCPPPPSAGASIVLVSSLGRPD